MGPSGSGKSTLLNIIGGMDSVTDGQYCCGDIEVSNLKTSKLHRFRKENIGFVFQQFALMNKYTIFENVEMPIEIILEIKLLPEEQGFFGDNFSP